MAAWGTAKGWGNADDVALSPVDKITSDMASTSINQAASNDGVPQPDANAEAPVEDTGVVPSWYL